MLPVRPARTYPFCGKTFLSQLLVPAVLLIFVCRMQPVIYLEIVRVSIYYHNIMMHLFQEENIRRGRIEVICGSMFSGKTEELIRRLKRARIARQRVEIYKPNIDTRYSDEDVVSHDRNTIPSTPVEAAASILLLAGEAEVVGIDEAQFFDDGLVEVCNNLANSGKRVIVAGLDMDFKGIPFGPVPALCTIAEDVTKVHAVCVRCGALAYVSHRTVADSRLVMLGEQAEYEPLCRACYRELTEAEKQP